MKGNINAFCAATAAELECHPQIKGKNLEFKPGEPVDVDGTIFMVTGIGMLQTFRTLVALQRKSPLSALIYIGIAGAYQESQLKIGEVVAIESEKIGDLGAEEKDGSFISADKLGFKEQELFYPNKDNDLVQGIFSRLTLSRGVSVNTCTGTLETAQSRAADSAGIETMEGVAVYMFSEMFMVPAVEVRSISNFAGVRDRESWNIPKAFDKLTSALKRIL